MKNVNLTKLKKMYFEKSKFICKKMRAGETRNLSTDVLEKPKLDRKNNKKQLNPREEYLSKSKQYFYNY